MMGGEWEDDGRNPQKFLMQSGRISVQPAQEVVSADQVNTACRLKKTGSSGIPSDVILMHDVSMLTSLPM